MMRTKHVVRLHLHHLIIFIAVRASYDLQILEPSLFALRLQHVTSEIVVDISNGCIDSERFFGFEFRLKDILRSIRNMANILGRQLYLNIVRGIQEMLMYLRNMASALLESNSYRPEVEPTGTYLAELLQFLNCDFFFRCPRKANIFDLS